MYEHLAGKVLTPKQQQIVENTLNASPETVEMAQRLVSGILQIKESPRKHIFELTLENLAQLEYKLKERFHRELWENGMNGKN